MSTKTAHLSSQIEPLVAHVPVDRFEIVNGPSATACVEIVSNLLQQVLRRTSGDPLGVEVTFTLKTAASSQEFKRPMKIIDLGEPMNGEVSFVAIFSARVVSGVYHMGKRKGWFNLD